MMKRSASGAAWPSSGAKGCDMEAELLTVAEAARLLRVAPSTLYGLARQNRIPHYRIGDRLLFDRSEVLKSCRRAPAAAIQESSNLRNL